MSIIATEQSRPSSIKPAHPEPIIFVLWGEGFDAAAASIFVTLFRQQRLATKIVAVQGNRLLGAYGIGLMPDLTLGEAIDFDAKARMYILPCSASRLARVENDPRIYTFFQSKSTSVTAFIVPTDDLLQLPSLKGLDVSNQNALIYRDWSNLADMTNSIIALANNSGS